MQVLVQVLHVPFCLLILVPVQVSGVYVWYFRCLKKYEHVVKIHLHVKQFLAHVEVLVLVLEVKSHLTIFDVSTVCTKKPLLRDSL